MPAGGGFPLKTPPTVLPTAKKTPSPAVAAATAHAALSAPATPPASAALAATRLDEQMQDFNLVCADASGAPAPQAPVSLLRLHQLRIASIARAPSARQIRLIAEELFPIILK